MLIGFVFWLPGDKEGLAATSQR